jgi:Bacterial mobilisation protein (MobC)
MGRPKKSEPLDQQLNISLSLAEYALLRLRAEALGQRMSSYARAVLLNKTVRIEEGVMISRYDRLVFQSWQRVGNNLNQIARAMNTLQPVPPAEIEAALAEVRRLIAEARR